MGRSDMSSSGVLYAASTSLSPCDKWGALFCWSRSWACVIRLTRYIINKIKIVNQYKTLRFDVEGHTDSTGSDKINSKLSQSRADAVKDYLISNGFPADMITSKGFGSANPIGDNKTSKGRQQNRRVEIFSEYAER